MTAWTDHCKEFCENHGCTYKEALSHPRCKSEYADKKEGGKIHWKKVGKKLGNVGMKTMNFQNKMAQKIGSNMPLDEMGDVGSLIQTGLDAQDQGVRLANNMYDRRKEHGGLKQQIRGTAQDLKRDGIRYANNQLKEGARDVKHRLKEETRDYLVQNGGRIRNGSEQDFYRNHIMKPVAIKKRTPSLYEPKIRGLGVVSNRDQETGTIESRIANIVKLRRDQKLGGGFRTASGYGFKT